MICARHVKRKDMNTNSKLYHSPPKSKRIEIEQKNTYILKALCIYETNHILSFDYSIKYLSLNNRWMRMMKWFDITLIETVFSYLNRLIIIKNEDEEEEKKTTRQMLIIENTIYV
jgi:hypothetical protein